MKILWIPHIGWHVPQRAHIFCRALAARHEIHVTDWIADFQSLHDYVSWRYVRNYTYRRYTDGPIRVHGIPRISPAIHSRLLRRLNTSILAGFARHIIQRYAIDAVVGTYLLPPPKAPRLIFDLFDENVSGWQATYPAYAAEIERVEQAYLAQADAVVAASSVLADKAHAGRARGAIFLITNGVDLAAYDHADRQRGRARLRLSGTLVGVVGNHNQCAELARVLDAAKLLEGSDIQFVIAGRGAAVAPAQQQAQRAGLHHVHFHDYVPPAELPDFLAALDVGLCPYSQTPMDDARSPMRLFNYAAAGLPSVSTDLLEVRRLDFPNVVCVEPLAVALAAGIERALTLPRARPPQFERYDLNTLAMHYEAILRGDALVESETMAFAYSSA